VKQTAIIYLKKVKVKCKNLKIKIYRIIILPVVLYGCETWSLTRREERKLRVFENMVLRRIFGPRSEEVTEEWRRLHNEELNDLYSSPNIVRVIKSRRMRWAGHVAHMGKERGCIGSWWGNRRKGDHCFIISLLYASTRFEHYVLIIKRSILYYTRTASGIITLCRWPSDAQVERGQSPLSTCAPDGHLQSVMIPDAV